ncbi:hypothetical protein CMI47_01645 [Candidatus Pacearchaeota archaeon]|nr:hypothetical protein [Candidatus Pacearchaeota archaeon]|tara:strand:+ start:739 stop:1170 length:432 start_codon:yes stop_codon:yes gene_type:complete
MTRRLFPDNDAWPTEASRAANNATVAFMDLLAILEEDGPVDLKDFHYILTSAAGSFVAGLSVTRRLGDSDAPPNPIVRSYPRLFSKYDDTDIVATADHDSQHIVEGYQKWKCVTRVNGICLYNDAEDPMHDNCIACGQPEERK